MIVLSAAYQQACRLAIWLDINQVQMYANCSGSCCHWSFNIIADRTGLKACHEAHSWHGCLAVLSGNHCLMIYYTFQCINVACTAFTSQLQCVQVSVSLAAYSITSMIFNQYVCMQQYSMSAVSAQCVLYCRTV